MIISPEPLLPRHSSRLLLGLLLVGEEAEAEVGEVQLLLLPILALVQAQARERTPAEEWQAVVSRSMVGQAAAAIICEISITGVKRTRDETPTGGATTSGSGSGSSSAAWLVHRAATPPTAAVPTAAAPTRAPKRPGDDLLTPVETGDCHEAALLLCSSSSACFLASACRSLQVSFFAPPAAAPVPERRGGWGCVCCACASNC